MGEALIGDDGPAAPGRSEWPDTPEQSRALVDERPLPSRTTPAQPPTGPTNPPTSPNHKAFVAEIWLVLALSLGADAVYAVLDLLNSLTIGVPLRSQSTVLNASAGANTSLLNLAYSLVGIIVAALPVGLVVYLLSRSGESVASIGLDRFRLGKETLWGAGLAACVGGAGLALYIGAYHAGLSVNIVPTNLPPVWWRIPILVLAAVQDGLLEEIVVCGYLLHRLSQLGWGENRSLATSAVLRGSYHLYQGFGGFLGNAVMGLLFGRLLQRKGRLARLIFAHSLIDTGAFVGYVLLRTHVSWLP